MVLSPGKALDSIPPPHGELATVARSTAIKHLSSAISHSAARFFCPNAAGSRRLITTHGTTDALHPPKQTVACQCLPLVPGVAHDPMDHSINARSNSC